MSRIYIKKDQAIAGWLFLTCAALVILIFIGGITRLTESGLSITEWNPVSGILPPMNEQEWQIEFDKYKKSPEYIKHNSGMVINEFKSIYWLEFIHRIAGRITSLLYIIPMIFFLMRGRITGRDISEYIFITLLFITQGVVGWYMVSSGLINAPSVSHYRLAMHLILAIIIYSLLFWQLMRNYFDIILMPGTSKLGTVTLLLTASLCILYCQIILGAFVAGLDAGLVYNSFPYMGESLIPYEINITRLSLDDFSNPVFVQLVHRMVAYILTFLVIITSLYLYSLGNAKLSYCAFLIILAITFQFITGIATLLYMVPISIALVHQLGSVFLLSTILWALFLVKNS